MVELDRLKACVEDENFGDAELTAALDYAVEIILAYTNRSLEQWKPVFDGIQLHLALKIIGQSGAEGLKSKTEGAVRFDFESMVETLAPFLNVHRLVNVR